MHHRHPLFVPVLYFVIITVLSVIILRDGALNYIVSDMLLGTFFLSIPWLLYRGIKALFYREITSGEKLRKAEKSNKTTETKKYPFLIDYVRALALISALSYLMLVIFVFEYGIRNPAKLPIYKIETSSGATVTFISMAHIGSSDFYQNVQSKVQQTLSESGSVILYEGVTRTSTGDLMISEILPDDLSKMYATIADRGGLVSQSESNTLIDSPRVIRADTTLEEIDQRYQQLRGSGSKDTATHPPLMSSDDRAIIEGALTPKSDLHREIIGLLIRSFLSFSIRELGGNGVEAFAQNDPHLAQVIIHDRDQIVARAIESQKSQRILVIYGALHVEGIIEELKKKDPNITPEYISAFPIF